MEYKTRVLVVTCDDDLYGATQFEDSDMSVTELANLVDNSEHNEWVSCNGEWWAYIETFNSYITKEDFERLQDMFDLDYDSTKHTNYYWIDAEK